EIGVSPLYQDYDPIAEAHKIHDVDEQPEEPRRPAGESHPSEIRDRSRPADRRKVTFVAIPEVLAWLATKLTANVLRGEWSILYRRRSNTRNRSAVLHQDRA